MGHRAPAAQQRTVVITIRSPPRDARDVDLVRALEVVVQRVTAGASSLRDRADEVKTPRPPASRGDVLVAAVRPSACSSTGQRMMFDQASHR